MLLLGSIVLKITLFLCQTAALLCLYVPLKGTVRFREKCALFLLLECGATAFSVVVLGAEDVWDLLLFVCVIPSAIFFWIYSEYKDGRFWYTFSVAGLSVNLADSVGKTLAETVFPQQEPARLILRCLLMICMVLVILLCIRKPYCRALECVGKGWEISATVMLLLYLIVLIYFAISKSREVTGFSLLFVSTILLSTIQTLYIIFNLIQAQESRMEEEEKRNEWKLAQQRIVQSEQQYRIMRESVEQTRLMRHDLSHHFRIISNYCGTGQYDKIQGYLNSLDIRNMEEQTHGYCRNHVANIIVGYYAAQAQEAGIQFSCLADLPEGVPENDTDLSVLLGNVLENAMEACRKAEGERKIDVRLRYTHHKLAVSVENSYIGMLREDNGELLSVKEEEGHGLGLKSIRRVLDKYDGFMEYKGESNVFCLKALLNIPD